MVTFAYPGYNPDTIITLPNPKLGDNYSLQKNISVQVSRSGVARSYIMKDTTRKVTRVELTFDNLNKDQLKSLVDFIIDSEGEFIKYTDYKGNEFICNFSEETIEETTQGRGATLCDDWDENKSINLTFDYWEL